MLILILFGVLAGCWAYADGSKPKNSEEWQAAFREAFHRYLWFWIAVFVVALIVS